MNVYLLTNPFLSKSEHRYSTVGQDVKKNGGESTNYVASSNRHIRTACWMRAVEHLASVLYGPSTRKIMPTTEEKAFHMRSHFCLTRSTQLHEKEKTSRAFLEAFPFGIVYSLVFHITKRESLTLRRSVISASHGPKRRHETLRFYPQ